MSPARPPAGMVVLGIDPGSVRTGWGIVDFSGAQPRRLSSGVAKTNARQPMAQRLAIIHRELGHAIQASPTRLTACAIENVYVGKNAPSALKLGHARGVAMLAAVQAELPVFEYTAAEIKSAVAGTGRASKEQVRHLVSALLRSRFSGTLDETDALAVALCHGFKATSGFWRVTGGYR